MRGRAALILVLVAAASLAACSDDDKDADVPPSTTTLETTTPTTADTGSTTTSPRTTPSTATTPTTSAPNGNSSVNLVGPTGPSSPVDCNAETTDIELRWTASGATKVELRIDGGPVFASYGNGTETELVPLECDGQPHEYEVTASAGGSTSSSSLKLRSA